MGEELNSQDQKRLPEPEIDGGLTDSANYRKTPMYLAIHAARYQRQQLIREIEETTDRTLLCYICGENAEIGRDDTIGIVESVA